MKAAITHAEALVITDWIREARGHLTQVEQIERRIATALDVKTAADRDTITDAIGAPMTVETLLRLLGIGLVDEPA